MRQVVARFRGSGLRIAVAVLLALAVTTAATVDQTEAQLPGVEVPGVVTVQTTPPKLTLPTPSLPPLNVTPPAVTVPATPVTPQVTIKPPTVQTPPVTLPKPSVTAPAPQVTLPQAPKAKAPAVAAPQLPQVDAPRTGARPQQPGAQAGPPSASEGSTAAGSGPAGGPSAATLASLGVPSAAELRAVSPAKRRQLLRRTWDQPLRGKRLRQLRHTVEQYQACLGGLPRQGRRALRLRAGIGPGQPVSRRVVARRLGLSLTRALRVERSALSRLVSTGERGLCDSGGGGSVLPATAAGAGGPASAGTGGEAGNHGEAVRKNASRDARDRTDPRKRADDPGYLFNTSRDGNDTLQTVFFLLLALLVLGLGVLVLKRLLGGGSSATPAAPVARGRRRPLLFLNAAGLISLQRTAAAAPRARSGASGSKVIVATYVSAQAREFVQHLTASFDLVLISGWRHNANHAGRVALENGELPILMARQGSADSKLRGVARVARNRPAAWIDEDIDDLHKDWAKGRPLPTLLVVADDAARMEEPTVSLLHEWAEQVALGERPQQRLVSQS